MVRQAATCRFGGGRFLPFHVFSGFLLEDRETDFSAASAC